MHEIKNVIASDMCVGCGTCAFVRPDSYEISFTQAGHWKAKIKIASEGEDSMSHLCPMSGKGLDESEIAEKLYPDLPQDALIGRYRNTYAGHVNEGSLRADGSSGGLVSWILAELFRRDEIDAVLHVKPAEPSADRNLLYKFSISESVNDMVQGSKSRYYPVEMSDVLAKIKSSPKRYAVVGLPCFIKAIRLMQESGVLLREETPFCLGLVCGHLKSHYFADYLAWQKQAELDSIENFDFRKKIANRRASDYGFSYDRRSPQGSLTEEAWPMDSVRGRDWGEGLLKNAACEYCDDVLAECADAVIGDAWLPEFINDALGTNILVTRHALIDEIVLDGTKNGALNLQVLTVDAIIQSQSSGLRHRREGLAHRLARRRQQGEWAPIKRVAPILAQSKYRREIYDARLEIAKTSADIYGQIRHGQLSPANFEKRIEPAVARYRRATYRESRRGLKGFIKRIESRLRMIFSSFKGS